VPMVSPKKEYCSWVAAYCSTWQGCAFISVCHEERGAGPTPVLPGPCGTVLAPQWLVAALGWLPNRDFQFLLLLSQIFPLWQRTGLPTAGPLLSGWLSESEHTIGGDSCFAHSCCCALRTKLGQEQDVARRPNQSPCRSVFFKYYPYRVTAPRK